MPESKETSKNENRQKLFNTLNNMRERPAPLSQSLPGLYGPLLNAKIQKLRISEEKATCDRCLRSRDQRFKYLYKNNLKCCTFSPFVPNYAVGGILAEGLQGAAQIKRQISSRQMSLPLGIFPTPEYQFQFFNKKPQDFGTRASLLCPFYDKQNDNCQIWSYRGVVCTTYFCTSSYGTAGKNYWSKLSDYLSYVEMALAEECLVNLDFSPRDISQQLGYLNMRSWTEEQKKQQTLALSDYKKMWNGYKSEYDFYIKCFQLVRKMKRSEFTGLIGEIGEKLESQVIKASQQITSATGAK